ncbi:MAG TPA: hypothetical protein VK731_03275 [Candidatus Cybelea sp.]|nr:hypothetical protein [Candidatus Cybelea sp.]
MNIAPKPVELWIGDAKTGEVHKVPGVPDELRGTVGQTQSKPVKPTQFKVQGSKQRVQFGLG